MVMGEKSPPRKTFVLNRGQYDQPSEVEVGAGLPVALGQWPDNLSRDRLGLAKWMTSGANFPADVARHREPALADALRHRHREVGGGFWRTGRVADTPRELLDWLATEFVRTGWNLKAMHKQIVMSATYRQSSRVTPALLEADPANRLYARGPRFRLPAEMIRDHALSASGLLVSRIGARASSRTSRRGFGVRWYFPTCRDFEQDHGAKHPAVSTQHVHLLENVCTG